MKKLLVVLAILFIGISLAGCISDPVVTPPLTPAPTTTVLPTEIPTVLPTANVTSNVTATETPNATETPRPVVPITFNEQGTITPGTIVSIPVGTTVSWINNDRFSRAVVLEVIPGAVRRPDLKGDCIVEVGDGDRCMEGADGDIVPGVFTPVSHSVCRSCQR